MIGLVLAAQIAVVAHAPDTATVCAPMEITVAARAHGTIAPRIVFPSSLAFQLLRSRASTRPDPDGSGQLFTVTEATYLVATPMRGHVTLPSMAVTAGPQRAVTRPLAITVSDAADDPDEPLVLVRAALDDGRGRGDADTLYVGQQVDYVVNVQLNAAARRRLRRNPTFFPPDMPAVLAYDVEPPAPVARAGPQCFESLTYRRALFPLFPGRTVIPPAVLTYALPVSTSFFSREESREVRTDSVQIVALEPPVDGRPTDYAGAVGSLRASARLGSPSGRMGDPLVLTVRLEGAGNVKLLPRPALSLDWAAVAPGAERVEVDTSHARVTGAKEFDWLLTPRRAGRMEVPAIRYPYFDPAHSGYAVAVTTSIGLDIAVASLASADTAVVPRLSVRSGLREEQGPSLPDRPFYWLLLAAAPLPATLRRVRRRQRHEPAGLPASRRLQLAAAGGTPLIARDVRRLFVDAIRERVPTLQPATARTPLARQLRRAGVTEASAEAAEVLLDRLDAAAFSGGGTLDSATVAEAGRIAADVDAQAMRNIVSRVARAPLVALITLVVAAGVALALPEGAARLFAEGVHAYDAADASLAARQFARAAARAPRAVDAWANLGTAAWARGDTARAAAGWQRALRLDPLDVDVRDRLASLPGGSALDARGYVPPAPPGALAGVALALWLAAWLALAVPPTRRPAVVRPMAGGALVVALVTLAAALELRDRLDPRGLGVLRASMPLREGPANDAGHAVSQAAAGEVGLLGAREGNWVRISLDGSRAGWVPTAAVLLLEDAASD